MNQYRLVLFPNGDIAIYKFSGSSSIRIYHRTYNIGDNIKVNLLRAYDVWEDLE